MEGSLFGIACACFVLAACALASSIVIFFRFDVADAVRFLRHKPRSHQGKRRVSRSRQSMQPPQELSEKPEFKDAERSMDASGSQEAGRLVDVSQDGGDPCPARTLQRAEGAENTTRVLEDEESERATSLLRGGRPVEEAAQACPSETLEPLFRFAIKEKVISVNTQEEI